VCNHTRVRAIKHPREFRLDHIGEDRDKIIEDRHAVGCAADFLVRRNLANEIAGIVCVCDGHPDAERQDVRKHPYHAIGDPFDDRVGAAEKIGAVLLGVGVVVAIKNAPGAEVRRMDTALLGRRAYRNDTHHVIIEILYELAGLLQVINGAVPGAVRPTNHENDAIGCDLIYLDLHGLDIFGARRCTMDGPIGVVFRDVLKP